MGFTNLLKGIGGEYEISRVVGAFGALVYIISVPSFVAYEVIWAGKDFDITAFCLAYSGGLAAITGGTALAVAHKDKNVAAAKVIAQTGAVPTPAIDGAKVPTGDPPPVDQPAEPVNEAIPDYAR